VSWITKFYISGKTPFGLLPLACPNCHQPIGLGDIVYSFGYFRHKKCHNLILKVRKLLGIDNLLKKEGGG